MSFSLCLFIIFLAALAAFCLGYHFGFTKADQCSFDEGYDFALSDNEVGWRLTASGEAALDAAEREPLAELRIHQGNPISHFPKTPTTSMP